MKRLRRREKEGDADKVKDRGETKKRDKTTTQPPVTLLINCVLLLLLLLPLFTTTPYSPQQIIRLAIMFPVTTRFHIGTLGPMLYLCYFFADGITPTLIIFE